MDHITEYMNCTGCRACEQICPAHAIEMKSQQEGFIYPVINNKKCINCGLCKLSCPANHDTDIDRSPDIYALKLKSNDIMNSASGGAFFGIARHVIENNGVVYGAAYNPQWDVIHIRVDALSDLSKLQGSKYVQSDTKNTFTQCKSDLKAGRTVLFSGTPCQIAGLYSYLKADYPNLFTIDLICHGVPSPLLFKSYINWLEKKNKHHITEYNFRSKASGWGLNLLTKTEERTKISPPHFDPYYQSFLSGDTYRECCYECKYSNSNRIGDFTIGDYWGIEKAHPEFNDKRGVSLIFVNSGKAKILFSKVSDLFYICPSKMELAIREQGNLKGPTPKPSIRSTIYEGIESMDPYKYINKQLYSRISISTKIKGLIPKRIKTGIKRLFKTNAAIQK